jgi:Asp-tRNA(Asn)/Glu-tRNA(Gln) amidotransferase A subunit family amidase
MFICTYVNMWQVVEFLRSRGARVVEISIPHLQTLSLSHAITISSEFALTWDRTHHDGAYGAYMEANTRITVGIGSSVSALEVLAAATNRSQYYIYVNSSFISISATH